MKEKKNIDRIYQEKFKDFEREPDENVWENISSRLDKKEEKRPFIIPLWMKIGGVAAVLALVMASLLFTENNNPLSNEPEVVFENPDEPRDNEKKVENEVSESKHKNEEDSSNAITFEAKDEEFEGSEDANSNNRSSNASSSARINKNKPSKTDHSIGQEDKTNNTSPIKETTVIADTKTNSSETTYENEKSVNKPEVGVPSKTSGLIAQSEEPAIDSTKTKSILEEQNALANIEKEKQSKKENEEDALAENSKKMRLSTFAAPVFYNNIGGGNELSNQFSENNSSSEVTLSYGVKFAYQISKKLSIRTGVSKVNVSNNIQNITYSPSARAAGFENISPIEDNLNISNNSPSNSGLPSGGLESNSSFAAVNFTPGEINQQFGYIEVPLELEFALIDKKFGLNIIGGGSSLFLDNNRVDLISEDSKTNLGEATNINSTSFSTNIGLGMDYDISKSISISVEPIFKYQLNAFSNVNDVQPTNFGIYSGLSFRF